MQCRGDNCRISHINSSRECILYNFLFGNWWQLLSHFHLINLIIVFLFLTSLIILYLRFMDRKVVERPLLHSMQLQKYRYTVYLNCYSVRTWTMQGQSQMYIHCWFLPFPFWVGVGNQGWKRRVILLFSYLKCQFSELENNTRLNSCSKNQVEWFSCTWKVALGMILLGHISMVGSFLP